MQAHQRESGHFGGATIDKTNLPDAETGLGWSGNRHSRYQTQRVMLQEAIGYWQQ